MLAMQCAGIKGLKIVFSKQIIIIILAAALLRQSVIHFLLVWKIPVTLQLLTHIDTESLKLSFSVSTLIDA